MKEHLQKLVNWLEKQESPCSIQITDKGTVIYRPPWFLEKPKTMKIEHLAELIDKSNDS